MGIKTIKSIFSRLMLLTFMGFVLFQNAYGQEVNLAENNKSVVDSLYREDQFYSSITYNLLRNTPEGFSNKKFSMGYSAGFLRDFPINKNRNIAIATGLGLTYNNYKQNIAITQTDQAYDYTLLTDSNTYSKNKFSQLFLDLPLEIRFRGSTFTNHSFWRFHAGVKLSYLLYNHSVLRSDLTNVTIVQNKDFNNLQYGTYIAAGYSGVNLYVYYGLKPIFQSTVINTQALNIQNINIGLIFYIL